LRKTVEVGCKKSKIAKKARRGEPVYIWVHLYEA